MLARDAVGEGVRQQVAKAVRRCVGRGRCLAAKAASPLPGGGVDRGQGAAVCLPRRAAGPERGQRLPACRQGVAALAQRVAGFDQGGEVAGQGGVFGIGRGVQHRGQARMGAQGQQPASEAGDARVGVQRAQPLQQFPRGGHRAGRRRVGKTQRVAAPGRQLQRQAGQFDLGDFRRAHGFQALRLGPEAVGPAFGNAAGATGALVGRGLGNRHGFESRKS